MEKKQVLNLISIFGAIVLFAGVAIYIFIGAVGAGTLVVSATFWMTLISACFMLVGLIFRLILYITKNESVSYNVRNVIGNGFVAFGALIAGVCTLTALIVDLLLQDETGTAVILQGVMCFGGWVCFIFGRLEARA